MIAAAILYKKLHSPNPEGYPGYFIVLGHRRTGAVGWLSACGAEVYQLARNQPHTLRHSVHQHVVGGDAGHSLWLVGLPASTNDGPVHRGVGGAACRGSGGVDCCDIATTIVYEIVKVWQASGKTARHAFLGKP